MPKDHQVVFSDPSDPYALGIARKGKGFLYGFRQPTTGVLLIPIIKNRQGDDEIVLLKTRRDAHEWTPNYQYTIDCVAGKVLAGNEQDKLAPCLLQKTGLQANQFKRLAKDVPLGSGYLSERDAVYLAEDATLSDAPLATKPDPSVLGKVQVPLNQLTQWLKQEIAKGATVSNNVYSALFLLLEHRLKGKNPFSYLTSKSS
jgi:hypothetical protein